MRAYIQGSMNTYDRFEVHTIELHQQQQQRIVAVIHFSRRAEVERACRRTRRTGTVFSIHNGRSRAQGASTRARNGAFEEATGSMGQALADLVVEAEDRQVHRDHDEADDAADER